jgi:hypothetical protein
MAGLITLLIAGQSVVSYAYPLRKLGSPGLRQNEKEHQDEVEDSSFFTRSSFGSALFRAVDRFEFRCGQTQRL